jgi:diacylglycerol kinase
MHDLAMTDPLEPPETARDDLPPTARKAAFGQTFRAVAWSFLGIRRSTDHEQDVRQLNPVHVIIAAVIGAALFVLVLVLLVHWVIGAAVAN